MPAGDLLGDNPDIVGEVRGVDQGHVVQQDAPGQHDPSKCTVSCITSRSKLGFERLL